MSIYEISSMNPNTLLVISAADLKEFALELMDECANSSKSRKKSDKYLTIAETAKKYGVSESTLYRWTRIGYLPKVKLGGKSFYRESDIIKLMEGGLV
jgi:excisionase family DNA binding protein